MSLGQKNQLVGGSLHSCKRAPSILSLIQSVRNNEHDPYAYLKDVLTRLTTQRAGEVTLVASALVTQDGLAQRIYST
jgi:hypothetical protein